MALGGGRGGMSAGAGRGILLPLIVLLSLLYILIACLSGYLFNRQADGKSILGTPEDGTPVIGNSVAFFLVFICLIASMLGLAAVIMGYYHSARFAEHSASGAAATAWIALLVNLLAFGIACKTLERGGLGGGRIGAIIKCVASFQIIVTVFQLIYNFLVHGLPTPGDDHVGRTASPAGVGTTGMGGLPKHHTTTTNDVV
jgi:ABC-type enterochelin transport system permease subunit